MSKNKDKDNVVFDNDDSYTKNEDYLEHSDVEEQPNIYSSDKDTEKNFGAQYQKDLKKFHALKKQLEEMRPTKRRDKSKTPTNVQKKSRISFSEDVSNDDNKQISNNISDVNQDEQEQENQDKQVQDNQDEQEQDNRDEQEQDNRDKQEQDDQNSENEYQIEKR
ncbi:1225_t:CDS:2 [Racocetra fulgida]|uniref:1225_t:CDS:1 n=1 Tax=Racocetra fulgida TaxID=60492 RepID=A0A9N9EWE9_9GLOM|nr:1225_t:CDS:2 [Racocetra fulgida]